GRAQLLARLDNRSVGNAAPLAVRRWQHEIEMMHDLGDAAIAKQAHPDDEPHHMLGWQFAVAHRRRPGRLQCIRDPLRIDRRAELLEPRRALTRAQGYDRLAHPHRPTSRGANHLLPAGEEIQNPATYALSDRHCG